MAITRERQLFAEAAQRGVIGIVRKNSLSHAVFQRPALILLRNDFQPVQVAVVLQVGQLHAAGNRVLANARCIVEITHISIAGQSPTAYTTSLGNPARDSSSSVWLESSITSWSNAAQTSCSVPICSARWKGWNTCGNHPHKADTCIGKGLFPNDLPRGVFPCQLRRQIHILGKHGDAGIVSIGQILKLLLAHLLGIKVHGSYPPEISWQRFDSPNAESSQS